MSANGPTPRLVHLCGFGATHSGSFIPMLASVLRAALERGWRVEAVFPPRAADRYWLRELRDSGVECQIVPDKPMRTPARFVSALLEESRQPTILHTHFSVYDIPAALATRRRSDVALVWHVHTVLSAGVRVHLTNLARFSLFGRSADLILCPAQNIADGMVARGAPRRRVEVFPSPIDVDFFPLAGAERRAAARDELEIPPDRTVLLHFGRDARIKGTDLFLAAADALAADDPSIHALLHVGDRRGLGMAQFERSALPDCVHLIRPVDDIRLLYAGADVLIAPSRGEGMPFVVVECLSSGTPVVASDLPGHRMLAEELDDCVVVDRDVGKIARATRAMLDRPEAEREEGAARAHAWVGERLRLEAATERLFATYDRLLAAHAGGGSADSR
jgi:alpha-1,3-rhamnosyl/mannosyltransferase